MLPCNSQGMESMWLDAVLEAVNLTAPTVPIFCWPLQEHNCLSFITFINVSGDDNKKPSVCVFDGTYDHRYHHHTCCFIIMEYYFGWMTHSVEWQKRRSHFRFCHSTPLTPLKIANAILNAKMRRIFSWKALFRTPLWAVLKYSVSTLLKVIKTPPIWLITL